MRLLVLTIILISPCISIGQSLQFSHITTEDGLTTGNVRAIIQDYQGIYWFGSEDGLMRYDGYEIVSYNHDEGDTTSISSNFILTLFEDSFRRLWIGTIDGGICYYNRERDSFVRYQHDPNDPASLGYNYVRAFHETKDKKLIIGFENSNFSILQLEEVLPYDARFHNLKIPIDFDKSKAAWGSSIVANKNGNLLIGVNGGGIYEFDPKQNSFSPFAKNDQLVAGVQKLCVTEDDQLWIGTWRQGLFVYDYSTDQMINFTTESPSPLLHNQTEAIEIDEGYGIWIGTDRGLHFVPKGENPYSGVQFEYYQHSVQDRSSLLSDAIKDIYIDKGHRVWVSSYYGGINIYDRMAKKFDVVRAEQHAFGGLQHNNVVVTIEDKQSNLWIGTDGGGVNFVPGGLKNLWKPVYKTIPELGKLADKVKCMEMDSKGVLYIGTWGEGMIEWNPDKRRMRQYKAEGDLTSISANEVLSIRCDSLDNLWIGTFSGGLDYYDRQAKGITRYPKLLATGSTSERDKINYLFIDQKGTVWACPEVGGLCRYDANLDRFVLVETKHLGSTTSVLSIFEDNNGYLWLGTSKIGLVKLDPQSGQSTLFDKTNGLPNNVIRALLQDNHGNMWIGSNKGLSVLDEESGRVINYDKTNGAQGNEFNTSYLCSNGTALFGGIRGMNVFVPEQIKQDSTMPNIVFTSFWINNNEVNVLDDDTPLKENILVTTRIELTYDMRSFSIGYAALDYSFGDKIKYRYRLDGFHDQWQYVDTERKATFTNMPPGSYLFLVQSNNSEGFWGDNEQTLRIHVIPAWWQTIYTKLALAALVTLSVLFFIRYRTYALEKSQRELEKLVRARTAEVRRLNEDLEQSNDELTSQKRSLEETVDELSNTKNQLAVSEKMAALGVFTAGIAHEINNPVNFIASANQKLIDLIEDKQKVEEDSKEVRQLKELAHITNVGVERTVQIVNSLRNYARNQPGSFERYDIIGCMEDALMILSHQIKHSSIEINKDTPQELKLDCMPGRISQVFVNLVSNALDAVDSGGVISIKIFEQDHEVVIEVADDGVGIEESNISNLFDPFFSTKEVGKGSGLGLYIVYGIITEHGGNIRVERLEPGTLFHIALPKIQSQGAPKPLRQRTDFDK